MAGDDATRMRLVELRSTDGPVRSIRFAPRITLVTGFGPQAPLATWIATALAGPRPAGVDGIVEVAGRALTLADLPATLLAPTGSLVLSDADLGAARRRVVEPRYRRVVERREGVQNQRAREEVARADAAVRFAGLERRLAEIEPALAEAIGRSERAARRAEAVARLQAQLETVDAAAAAAREPHPDALELAGDWDTAQRQWEELVATGPALPIGPASERVAAARAALEQAHVRRATPEDAARLHQLQQVTIEARATQDADGDAAGSATADGDAARSDAAEEWERSGLGAMGHTHASFLLGLVAPGAPSDDIAVAEKMLALADDELRKAEAVAALPQPSEIAERRLELRGRAAEVLGRFPGDDVSGELRAFRPGAPALVEARGALMDAAASAGITSTQGAGTSIDDVVRHWLDEEARHLPEDTSDRVRDLTGERDEVETELRTSAAELVAIAARLRDLDRTLGELAVQETRLSAEFGAELSELAPDELEQALADVLDEFLAGERGPGRLPVFVGGVTSAFDGANCDRAIRQLERVSRDLQVVLVVDRPAVEAWVRGFGDGAAVWSPDVAARAEAAEHARLEAEERTRREAEQRAVREAEERAGLLADERARREAEDIAHHAIPPAPRPAPASAVVDLTAEEITDALTERAAEVAGGGEQDWWVPIGARPGASRAARPVGEDLAQRRRRAEQITADSASPTFCDVHRNVETALRCERCGLPFCGQCLALLGEPPALHCVDCALEISGMRSDRAAGRA
ncbi:MAG: hypothetical protein JWL83_4526 [Actinomycetia bacterium]|nr:hypothetical protein [Actinomycetes bacterium]